MFFKSLNSFLFLYPIKWVRFFFSFLLVHLLLLPIKIVLWNLELCSKVFLMFLYPINKVLCFSFLLFFCFLYFFIRRVRNSAPSEVWLLEGFHRPNLPWRCGTSCDGFSWNFFLIIIFKLLFLFYYFMNFVISIFFAISKLGLLLKLF